METVAKYRPNVEVASDREHLSGRTADLFASAARKAIDCRGVFCVAMSGGHTPKRFFELLASRADTRALPWSRIHVFWVDERYVPPESPFSNYRLAMDTFLSKVDIPPDNIHPIPTQYEDIKVAASHYGRMMRDVFNLKDEEMPSFDLIVLGMGVDGHTASLFPNSYAPFEADDLACVVYLLGDTLNRISLTHPVLRAARQLVVMVAGEEKAQTLKAVLSGEPDEVRYPIHILWPALDKILWLVDRDAAKAM